MCGGLTTFLVRLNVLKDLELGSLDARFRLLARPERASRDVVLAVIDDKSLEAFKQNNVVWKWPRDIYAVLVRYLQRGGARVIVFDILFSDPDTDRLGTDAEETDGAFAQAMHDAGNVVLASHLLHREDLLNRDNPLVRSNPFSVVPASGRDRFPRFTSAVLPIPLFQESAAALGSANYTEDPGDGICRRVPLLSLLGKDVFPHLGLAACLLSGNTRTVEVLPSGRLRVAGREVPVDPEGRFRVSWYGRGGPGGCFPYYSVAALVTSAVAEETGHTPVLPSSRFRDKIVIVGAGATGLFDFRSTPFTGLEPYPAMEIYATVLSNLLQGDFLVRVPPAVPCAAVFLFSLAVCASFFLSKRVRTAVVVTALCGAGWMAVSLALFRWHTLWLDLVGPELSLLVSFTLAAVVSYRTEGRERRRIRAVFNRYVSPAVVSEILENPEELALGGKEVTASIFFSDIRDFTAISEDMSPPVLVELLNNYFTLATDRILRNQGLLDKYIGDAVMAVFGALLPDQPHAVQACTAALEIQEAFRQRERTAPAGAPPLETRIGIHTGSVVAGNIGSPLRMQYTAMGDTVNIASRLEGANKVFASRILVSESTLRATEGAFTARELDWLRLKGKKTAVACYELLGRKGEVSEETERLLDLFQEGLRWYRVREFQKALAVFESLLESFPGDTPSRIYLHRCGTFLASPPPPDWDGSYKMDTK